MSDVMQFRKSTVGIFILVVAVVLATVLIVLMLQNGSKVTEKLQAEYDALKKEYTEYRDQQKESERKLTENNEAMKRQISDMKTVNTDMGAILSRQTNTIDAALQLVRDMRVQYNKQKVILYE